MPPLKVDGTAKNTPMKSKKASSASPSSSSKAVMKCKKASLANSTSSSRTVMKSKKASATSFSSSSKEVMKPKKPSVASSSEATTQQQPAAKKKECRYGVFVEEHDGTGCNKRRGLDKPRMSVFKSKGAAWEKIDKLFIFYSKCSTDEGKHGWDCWMYDARQKWRELSSLENFGEADPENFHQLGEDDPEFPDCWKGGKDSVPDQWRRTAWRGTPGTAVAKMGADDGSVGAMGWEIRIVKTDKITDFRSSFCLSYAD